MIEHDVQSSRHWATDGELAAVAYGIICISEHLVLLSSNTSYICRNGGGYNIRKFMCVSQIKFNVSELGINRKQVARKTGEGINSPLVWGERGFKYMKSSYNAYYNNKLCLKYVLIVKKFSHPQIPAVYSAS